MRIAEGPGAGKNRSNAPWDRAVTAAAVIVVWLAAAAPAKAGGAQGGDGGYGGGFLGQTNVAGTTPVYFTPEEAAQFEEDTATFVKAVKIAIEAGYIGTGAVLGFLAAGPYGAAAAIAANPMTPPLIVDVVTLSAPDDWARP